MTPTTVDGEGEGLTLLGDRIVKSVTNNLNSFSRFKKQQARRRCDAQFHKTIRRITESSSFNGFIMSVIFINAIIMAMESEDVFDVPDWQFAFKVLDYTFLLIYLVEFLLKVYAEPVNYWSSGYNIFDFTTLVTSMAQVIISWAHLGGESRLQALRVLRALRTLRMLRTVSFIRGLQVLVVALIDTIRKWVISILALLLLLMFLFGIMGYYFFGYPDVGDKENWGTLGAALLTLFSYVTVDGWTDQQDRLDNLNFGAASRVYTIIFIVLGHFIFSNVFIGVVIMNISEATELYKTEQESERAAILHNKKEFMMIRQHNDVKQMLERQKRGKYSNFEEMVHEFQKGLCHNDVVFMTDLCANLFWLEAFILTLDHMDTTMSRVQQLHFEVANVLAVAMETKLSKKYGM